MLHLLALPLAFVGDHDALHPANASLYFEVPNVPALVSAYEAAPLMQWLADPVWSGFAAKALGEDPESFRLDAWCFDYLAQGLDEVASMAGSDVDLRAACTGLRSFSISLSAQDVVGESNDARARVGAVLILDYATPEDAQRGVDFCVGAMQLIPEEVQHKQAALSLLGQEGLAQRYRHTNPGDLPEVWSATCGSSVVFGVGAETPDAWRALADRRDAQLGGNPDFAAGAPSPALAESVRVYDAFVDTRRVDAALEALQGCEPLAAVADFAESMLDLLPVDAYVTRCQSYLSGDRFVNESVSSELAVLNGLGVAPVSRRAVEFLPPDTMAAWATSVRAEDLEPLLMELVATWLDSDVAEARRFLFEDAAIDARAELLEPLGAAAALYVMPFAGPTIPELGVIVEVEDRERLQAGLDKLFALVEERYGAELDMRGGKYRGQAVYSIQSRDSASSWGLPDLGPANMLLDMLKPGVSVAVMEDRVLISMERRFVTREVKRVLGLEEGAPMHALAAGGVACPEVSMIDWGAGLASLYEMVRTLAPMVGAGTLPFDPDSLPPTEALTRHFRPSVAWTIAGEHGRRAYAESSFGPESTLLVTALIGLAAYEATNTIDFIDRPVTEPAAPLEPVEPEGNDGSDG